MTDNFELLELFIDRCNKQLIKSNIDAEFNIQRGAGDEIEWTLGGVCKPAMWDGFEWAAAFDFARLMHAIYWAVHTEQCEGNPANSHTARGLSCNPSK